MIGAKVRTSGYFDQVGNQGMLRAEPFDMNPVWVNFQRISRDQRKALLECQHENCEVVVSGTVRHVDFGGGIVADTIEVEP